MRGYIAARKYRSIPVGYSAADVSSNRYQLAQYMNCGTNATDRSDFFSFNSYSWCDPNTFVGSGWSGFAQMYSNYSIPLFLSEYGCNTNPPRPFQEVQALYSTSEMASVYSGGLVYEYTEEADNPNVSLCLSAPAITRSQSTNTTLPVRSRNRQLPDPSHAPHRLQQPPGHVQSQPPPHRQHWRSNKPRKPALPSYVCQLASRW